VFEYPEIADGCGTGTAEAAACGAPGKSA
jgi:hypothetical protein